MDTCKSVFFVFAWKSELLAFAGFLHPLREFGARKYFTDHCTPNSKHGFGDSVLVCKILDCYCRIRKKFAPCHSLHSNDANDYNGIVWKWNLHENKPLQNSFKRIQHCIQLFKLYSISIILFLKNNLTNICCKISKIGMNIWMVYICNMNNSGKYSTKGWEEGECTLQCWSKSSEICDCSRPF